jgi:LuxR family maltose regulon positive regulatory protein
MGEATGRPDAGPAVAGEDSRYRPRIVEVRRDRLLDELVGSGVRAVCLTAGSGYGKTTLLRQWAAADARRFVLLRGHALISHPADVAAQLAESFGDAELAETLPMPGDLLAWYTLVLPAIERICASLPEPVVVVIDDATSLAGPAWNSLLDGLIEHLPAGSVLCVATQDHPPPALRGRRSQQDALEFDAGDLRLDAVESADLLTRLGVELDDDEFLTFLDRTEGWPALVYFGGRAVRDGLASPSLPSTSTGMIGDFIRDSVLEPLDDEMTDFVLGISVLHELTGPLCEAVTHHDDSLRRLRELAASNSLVVPVDGTGTRFRLHHLLADVLSDELRARSLTRWRAANEAASEALEADGDLDGAIRHAIASDDLELISRQVWPHAPRLIGAGRTQILRRWLDEIPPERIERSRRLAIAAAWAAQHVGDVLSMNRFRLMALESTRQPGDDELEPHVDLLTAAIGADGVDSTADLASSCLDRMPESDLWRTGAAWYLGNSLLLLGRPDEAAPVLERGREHARAAEMPLIETHLVASLFLARDRIDDHQRAFRALADLRALLTRFRFDFVAAPAYTALAIGSLAEGHRSEARTAADTALRMTSQVRPIAPWHAVEAPLLLAKVFLALGEPRRATALLAEADEWTTPQSACPLNDELREEVQRGVAAAEDPTAHAEELTLAEIRVLQYLPTHLTFPEIAAELFVSRYTVKTQALAAYRKLGVHSRSEAVERARLLGLLPPE